MKNSIAAALFVLSAASSAMANLGKCTAFSAGAQISDFGPIRCKGQVLQCADSNLYVNGQSDQYQYSEIHFFKERDGSVLIKIWKTDDDNQLDGGDVMVCP